MFLIVSKLIAAIILLLCLGFIAYWIVAAKQGNCDFHVLKGKKSSYKVDFLDLRRLVLSCTVPIKNEGRQNGTIIDAFVRPYLPQEQYDKAEVRGLLMDTKRPRDDDYWEALIVEPGKSVELKVKLLFTAKSGNILDDLEDFPDMAMDILYETVGRSDWRYEKSRIHLTKEELRNALYKHTAGGKA